jgi:hypothetical protein
VDEDREDDVEVEVDDDVEEFTRKFFNAAARRRLVPLRGGDDAEALGTSGVAATPGVEPLGEN